MELFAAQWSAASGWSEPLPAVDGPHTLVLVFAGSAALAEPGIADVVSAYPTSVVTGCSTAGEIQGEQVHDDTVTVSIARFSDTTLTSASAPMGAQDQSRACGAQVGRRLRELDGDLRAAFVLSDGLHINGSDMTDGLAAEVGDGVAITGGLAGDGDRFGSTWVLVDGEPREGWIAAVGLSGPHLQVGHGSRGGWDIFGPERLVTRAEGNVLFELDGAPALALYKTYLGDRAEGLPATALLFPLAVRAPGATEEGVVRTILAIDEEAQTMTFAGDVPEGSFAQLMRANLDRLIDGAHEAALATVAGAASTAPTLAIAVSCVGRRLVLGARTEEELEVVQAALGPQTSLTGFYSYGEISPATGPCALHNQTMTLTTLGERSVGEG